MLLTIKDNINRSSSNNCKVELEGYNVVENSNFVTFGIHTLLYVVM